MMFYETKFQLFPHSGWCCSKNQLPFIHHKIGDVCAIDNYKQIVSSFNWHYLSILYCLEKEPIWKLSWVKTWLINKEKSEFNPKVFFAKRTTVLTLQACIALVLVQNSNAFSLDILLRVTLRDFYGLPKMA